MIRQIRWNNRHTDNFGLVAGSSGTIDMVDFDDYNGRHRLSAKKPVEERIMTVDQMYNEAEKLKDDGKLEEAITKLTELLNEDASHTLSHLALAVLLGKVGQHDKAVQHGSLACELDPNDPFNFTAMSVTYQRAWQGTQNSQYIQLAEDAMAKAHELEGRQ
jgi:tetratricopeptide (TPR) repeat protein